MSAAEREIEELIGRLADEYTPAFARAHDVFLNDERVEGFYLSGSLGRGECDEWSDLDLTVLSSWGFDAFVSDSHGWVARISEPVWSSRTTFGTDSFLVSWIDREWRRFDVVASRVSPVSTVPASLRRVFDRVDRPVADERPTDPRLAGPRLRSISDEFLRVLGLLVPVTGRGELEAAVTGVYLLRTALIELFTLSNGGASTGAKRLRSVLSAEQITALQALPDPGSTAESIQTAHLAVAAAFLPLARDLARQWDVEWPAEFEAATRDYLKRGLAADLP